MAGLIRAAGEEAAKNVGSTAPFSNLNLGTLGSVTQNQQGMPVVTPNQQIRMAQNQLLNAGTDAGTAARGFIDPTAQFGQTALATGGGLIADAAGFDPLAAAEERFGRLSSVLQPGRDRQRSSLESRLFAQGRLDSTGGNVLGGELEAGFAGVDANLLDRMFLESQQAQQQAQALGLTLGQGGAGVGGGLFGQLQQGASGAQGLDQGLLQTIGASGEVGQRFLNRDIASSNAINSFNASPAAGGKESSGVGASLGMLAGAGLGFATAGPGGGMAGAQAGASFGSGLGGATENLFFT